jgi:hypothetical protein
VINAQESDNIELVGQWAEGACYTTFLNENVALMNNGCYVVLIDVTDPDDPKELSRILTPAFVNSVIVHDDVAYIGSDSRGLTIVDIADPGAPEVLSFTEIRGFYAELTYHDGHIFYISNSSDALHIFDVSDPAQPEMIHESGFHSRSAIAIHEEYMYVAARWDGLRLYSIADMKEPFELDSIAGMYCYDIRVDREYLYALTYDSVVVYNIADPEAPVFVNTIYPEFGSMNALMVNDGILFTAERTRLRITDVGDPVAPVTLASISGETGFIIDLYVGDTLALLASNHNGMRIVNISDLPAPELAGSQDSGGSAYGVAVKGNYAYLADGWDGLRIFDITDPTEPELVGDYPTPSHAYKVEIIDKFAYVANGDDGLLILDVSDPVNPVEYTTMQFGDASVRNITLDIPVLNMPPGFLFVALGNRGVVVVNIMDPALPYTIDSIGTEDRVYDVASAWGILAVANWSDGVKLYSRSPFHEFSEIGTIENIGRIQSVEISGNYLYAGMDNPYVRVFDISEPSAPVQVGEVFTARGYELEVNDDRLYVSAGYNGVLIYDISDPTELEEIGYYNTGGEVYDIALAPDNQFLIADYNAGMAIFNFQTSATYGGLKSTDASLEILNVYPNPSEGPLSVIFHTKRAQDVTMRIFDFNGRLVDILLNAYLQPGTYTQSWRGDVSGAYFIELHGDNGRVLAPIVIQ